MTNEITSVSPSLPSQRLSRDDVSQSMASPTQRSDRSAQVNESVSTTSQRDSNQSLAPKTVQKNDERRQLVDEGARLAQELRKTEAERDKLIAERDQPTQQTENNESAQEALQRVRESARTRIGKGNEDAGPLVEDSYFVNTASTPEGSTISALERQAALTKVKLDDIETQFKQTQNSLLTTDAKPIETPEAAQKIAQAIQQDIAAEPIVNISTLTAKDGTDVLAILSF